MATPLASAVKDAEDQMFMVVGFEVLACSIQRKAGEKHKDISCTDPEIGKPITPQEVTKGTLLFCPQAWRSEQVALILDSCEREDSFPPQSPQVAFIWQ